MKSLVSYVLSKYTLKLAALNVRVAFSSANRYGKTERAQNTSSLYGDVN